jgi:hypothetical protein
MSPADVGMCRWDLDLFDPEIGMASSTAGLVASADEAFASMADAFGATGDVFTPYMEGSRSAAGACGRDACLDGIARGVCAADGGICAAARGVSADARRMAAETLACLQARWSSVRRRRPSSRRRQPSSQRQETSVQRRWACVHRRTASAQTQGACMRGDQAYGVGNRCRSRRLEKWTLCGRSVLDNGRSSHADAPPRVARPMRGDPAFTHFNR